MRTWLRQDYQDISITVFKKLQLFCVWRHHHVLYHIFKYISNWNFSVDSLWSTLSFKSLNKITSLFLCSVWFLLHSQPVWAIPPLGIGPLAKFHTLQDWQTILYDWLFKKIDQQFCKNLFLSKGKGELYELSSKIWFVFTHLELWIEKENQQISAELFLPKSGFSSCPVSCW